MPDPNEQSNSGQNVGAVGRSFARVSVGSISLVVLSTGDDSQYGELYFGHLCSMSS